jgi:hypothetical protein
MLEDHMSTAGLPRSSSVVLNIRQSRYLVMIVLGTATFWLSSILAAGISPDFYRHLAREDGLLELMQVAILIGCAFISGSTAVMLSKARNGAWAICYALGALVLFWIAGEEISWGQRIFGLSTPDALDANIQGELNLHNLPGVMSRMHRLVIFSLLVVSVTSIAVWTREPDVLRRWRVHLWVPHPILIGIWLCFWSYSWIRALDMWYFGQDDVHHVVSRLQESAELILYTGVLVFLVMAAVRVRDERKRGPSGSA